jgi:MarR family transcriptional regulator, transcriptional regulator for hemolysin
LSLAVAEPYDIAVRLIECVVSGHSSRCHRAESVVLEYEWESSIGYWVCTTSHALRRALSTELGEEGMTFRQWEVLAWLSANGNLSQAEMAECMQIEPHTLAGVLRRMERDGWLDRKCCEHDRRKNMIVPTEKAEEVWVRAVECCHRVRDRAVEGLSETELEQFKQTCEKVRATLAADIPVVAATCDPLIAAGVVVESLLSR